MSIFPEARGRRRQSTRTRVSPSMIMIKPLTAWITQSTPLHSCLPEQVGQWHIRSHRAFCQGTCTTQAAPEGPAGDVSSWRLPAVACDAAVSVAAIQ